MRGVRYIYLWVAIVVLSGCAGERPHLVWFEAPGPSLVDLGDMETLGVICLMNIGKDEDIDQDYISNQIADDISLGLRELRGKRIVEHDEIRWAFKLTELDSSAVRDLENLRHLREKLELDGLVLVEMNRAEARLQRRLYPVGPAMGGGMMYGEATPLVYLYVAIQFDILDLRTGESIWRKEFERSRVRPIEIQIIGGGKERQILETVRPAIRYFLSRLTPLRKRKIRGFVI